MSGGGEYGMAAGGTGVKVEGAPEGRLGSDRAETALRDAGVWPAIG